MDKSRKYEEKKKKKMAKNQGPQPWQGKPWRLLTLKIKREISTLAQFLVTLEGRGTARHKVQTNYLVLRRWFVKAMTLACEKVINQLPGGKHSYFKL